MLRVNTIKIVSKITFFLIVLLSLSACVTTQAPKISHVHVGHAMTAWRDTPNEQGLFVIAEKEAVIAYEHAQYAVENSHDLKLIKMHTVHVQHAMDPALVSKNKSQKADEGPGLGYGFIKAINSSSDHISFAADSKDASDNIKIFSQVWLKKVSAISERNELIVTLSQALLKSPSHEEAMVLAEEIQLLTEQNLKGYDSDGDGTIGNVKEDYGVKQLKDEINKMIAREDPPYQTVEKRYLFGLIRMPSGEWIFNLGNNASGNSGGFQY